MKRMLSLLVLGSCAAVGPWSLAATIAVSKDGPISTIQAGIDAASPGDTVRIEAGTYQENPHIPTGRNGLVVEADGAVTIEALPAGGAPAGPGIVVESSDVALDGLRIRNADSVDSQNRGIGVLVLAPGFRARKLNVVECDDSGIQLEAGQAVIEDCSFQGNFDGIDLAAVADVRVEDCVIRQCDQVGITASDCTDLEIVDCTFIGIEDGNAIRADGSASAALAIRGCRVINCDIDAFCVSGVGVTVEDCDVDTASGGVAVIGQDIAVLGNEFRFILGNPCISVLSGSDIRIEGNTIRDFDQEGIAVDDSASAVIVRGNKLRDAHGVDRAAIGIDGGDCVVEDNDVRRCADDAYRVEGAGNTLTGNLAKDCAKDGFDIATSASLTVLDGNTAVDCAGEGLDHSGAASTIRNNVFEDCRLDLATDGTAVFTDNAFATGGELTAPEVD